MTADCGPLVQALHATADLMDRDDTRCRALYGAPVGIPPSMGDHLIWVACTGGMGAWRREWLRLAREVSLDAAKAWSAERTRLRRVVAALVYPEGANAGAASPAEVRALADRLAKGAAA